MQKNKFIKPCVSLQECGTTVNILAESNTPNALKLGGGSPEQGFGSISNEQSAYAKSARLQF